MNPSNFSLVNHNLNTIDICMKYENCSVYRFLIEYCSMLASSARREQRHQLLEEKQEALHGRISLYQVCPVAPPVAALLRTPCALFTGMLVFKYSPK